MSSENEKGYEKPEVTRIDLTLEETLSGGCKVASGEDSCWNGQTPGELFGS
jgi:hypothetical protein